jgi:CheY-like chemotaxis protein
MKNSKIPNSSFVSPNCKIIALSASSFKDELATALVRGCDDFLRKPFQEAEVFEMLQKHLGVRFVYKEGEGQKVGGKGQKAEDVLTPEILAALPEDVLAEFRNAVEGIDLDRAHCIIDRIRLQNAPLAEALAELVKEYRFDVLQALFAKVKR